MKIMESRGLPVERYVRITDLGIEKFPGPVYNEGDLEIIIAAVKRQ